MEENNKCRFCQKEEETATHVLCRCRGLSRERSQLLGTTKLQLGATVKAIKQGPLKATIPISGVVKPTSNVQSGFSPIRVPSISPHFPSWRHRSSPDHSSGQRSPGSSTYKGKSKHTIPDVIRRTASLDTIYLKGQWPKDYFFGNMGEWQVDKAIQTEDSDWSDSKKLHYITDVEDKYSPKPKVRGDTLNNSSQTLASCMPLKPLPKSSMRNSVEGLNQEIERIVLSTGSGQSSDRYELQQITPEGHRAPLAEMLRSNRSRSVNTQTPQDFSHSSGDSHGSSPDNEGGKFGTSPHINRFLAREPPDGCEKVRLKSLDEKTNVLLEHAPQPSTFKLRPSLGSAFKILQPALSPSEEQAEPIVPPDN